MECRRRESWHEETQQIDIEMELFDGDETNTVLISDYIINGGVLSAISLILSDLQNHINSGEESSLKNILSVVSTALVNDMT